MIWLLAHGADPTPLPWDELLANLVKFAVTIGMVLVFASQVVGPLFDRPGKEKRQEMLGWAAVCSFLVLGMGWWLTRQSLAEAVAEAAPPEFHQHLGVNGGQVAMWGDYHVELARVISGEYRIWLSDAYRRPIRNDHYWVKIAPRKDGSAKDFVEMEASLGGDYRFAFLDRREKTVQLHVGVPGWDLKLNFDFDESNGKRTLVRWCGTSK